MINVIATAGEIAKTTSNGWLSITLDIAALLSALVWPAALLIIFLSYRKQLPRLAKAIASRISKLEFGGVAIELAKATSFAPDWSAGSFDLRHKAAAIDVTDSTAGTFLIQLKEGGEADYAVVHLGAGQEWLTSRLYIMAIVFGRMKGIKCFVFLEDSGGVRKRFVCWANTEHIRWSLARRCPWYEEAYTEAYSAVLQGKQAFVVSHEGRLGYQFSMDDPGPSIELLKEFLQRVQAPAPPQPAELTDWIVIDDLNNTHEHARWTSSQLLEDMLGEDAHRSSIHSLELRLKGTTQQLKTILSMPDRFVPVTAEDQRFEYLIDRTVILEQVARQLAYQMDDRSL